MTLKKNEITTKLETLIITKLLDIILSILR